MECTQRKGRDTTRQKAFVCSSVATRVPVPEKRVNRNYRLLFEIIRFCGFMLIA